MVEADNVFLNRSRLRIACCSVSDVEASMSLSVTVRSGMGSSRFAKASAVYSSILADLQRHYVKCIDELRAGDLARAVLSSIKASVRETIDRGDRSWRPRYARCRPIRCRCGWEWVRVDLHGPGFFTRLPKLKEGGLLWVVRYFKGGENHLQGDSLPASCQAMARPGAVHKLTFNSPGYPS